MKTTVNKVVILGGGTAGWMAAAALSEKYKEQNISIQLVESSDIGSVGVGEATVPGILKFHRHLKIPEREFIRATNATFKLGIEFRNWYKRGQTFFHPFAAFGTNIAEQDFYQCWLKLYKEGTIYSLEDFCLSIALARAGRFAQPDENATNRLAFYSYAYHFDASLYAKYLREYAEKRGVVRIDNKMVRAQQDKNDGCISALVLEDGSILSGDFFIDCSGFRSELIGKYLKTDFEDWSHWLPCDRAAVVQSENHGPPRPYTWSTALAAGWQWNIPLQHRTGNGYVYCSHYLDDHAAVQTLLNNLEGKHVNEPRIIQFRAGIRKQFWYKNCVCVGLASGFIEPLESTSISLIQTGIEKVMQFMPNLKLEQKNIDEANRLNRLEYERIRDFIILHYFLSERNDSDFWQYVRSMDIPSTLMNKVSAFKENGTVLLYEQESFLDQSWIAIFNGFTRIPESFKDSVKGLNSTQLKIVFEKMRHAVKKGIEYAPMHSDFVDDAVTEAKSN